MILIVLRHSSVNLWMNGRRCHGNRFARNGDIHTLYFIFQSIAVYYSWTKYKELSSNSGNTTSTVLSVATGLDSYVNSERTWYWLSKYESPAGITVLPCSTAVLQLSFSIWQ